MENFITFLKLSLTPSVNHSTIFIFIKLFVTLSTPVQQQDEGVMRYNADRVLETVTRPTKIGKLSIASYYDEMKTLSFMFTLSCE